MTTNGKRLDSTVIKFFLNGLLAAAIHFLILHTLYVAVSMPYAGIANGIAAVFGSTASFVGNRCWVFQAASAAAQPQALRFGALYLTTSLLHSATLWLWTDIGQLDFRLGFLIATAAQAFLTFIGADSWVFRH